MARANLARAEAELELSMVRSPIDGRVLEVHAREGERVGTDGIAEIADTSAMYAVAEVYETDIGRVRTGQRATLRTAGPLSAEVNDRRITVVDLFTLGTSFGIDGSLVTSDLNYQRLFPDRPPGFIELGLIHLEEGADPDEVQRRLTGALENDVRVLTRPEFIDREVRYWGSTTPIGYVFGFGAVMGLIVGGVIVYQILFADVSEHLSEYATLKAIG